MYTFVGTDSNRTNKMCFITHGESIFREFDFLHDAGLTNLDILHGATSTAADIFGLSDRASSIIELEHIYLLLGNESLK